MNFSIASLRLGCKAIRMWEPSGLSVNLYLHKSATNIVAKNEMLGPKKIKTDLIGPADPISNLRPVVFKISENESSLEKKLRIQREELQKWNQTFWLQHNNNFYKQKQDYMRKSTHRMKNELSEKKALTSEEMSLFYKDFLDKNWEVHLKYNVEWYKKNFKLLFLTYRVKWNGIIRKFLSQKTE